MPENTLATKHDSQIANQPETIEPSAEELAVLNTTEKIGF
jgi:hypothetical protein